MNEFSPLFAAQLNPRSAALPEMATAVLILDEARQIEYVNHSADELFSPINPIGLTFATLLMNSGAEAESDVFRAIDTDLPPEEVRIRLDDGRLLDCMLRVLSSGGFVLSLDDVTSLVRNAELARRDPLTGLPNRAALREKIAETLKEACGEIGNVAILYVDLDRFKAINDSLGHAMGDALLQKVADRFRKVLHEGEFIARLGGDEFAIIQSGLPQPAAAEELSSRLVDLIARAYAINGHMLHIGASIGVAIYPGDGREAGALLRNADLALYRAKAEGRGSYRFYEPGMDERMQQRRAMEIDLRRALPLGQLHLVYQPKLNLQSNSLVGFEALIRWSHPQRGLVSPADFIPLAEEIGAIVNIGEWALREACRQAASWPKPVSVAVNLSPVQFRTGKILQTVSSALAYSRLEPSRLELEITEGALMEHSSAILGVLNGLRALGVRIAMDDFGTGYSSLGYLQKFPFDAIKIDRSFVRGIDTSAERRVIVRAITQLASALGMTTTAEGIETWAQLECVREEGCTDVQGYLTGRPLSREAARMLLDHRFAENSEMDLA
ncbi:EAL domain-containing protein [Altererythrobacter xixiisoli]|uniref:EAL domain-containing protein n=1 Tax=Croceibacterium xixiisoli TaxID=1476466 RepID=A0A6I4TX84_9SPHN|nr:EAL domain-containing protein [Croceibacterium xixiisoli]MXP00776.1 EAL domain-containing protein [Croceibacterium xixiisoli]